jgi:hypothetical protein
MPIYKHIACRSQDTILRQSIPEETVSAIDAKLRALLPKYRFKQCIKGKGFGQTYIYYLEVNGGSPTNVSEILSRIQQRITVVLPPGNPVKFTRLMKPKSSKGYLVINAQTAGKGDALADFVQNIGVLPDQIAKFGDNPQAGGNDEGLIRGPNSYSVGHMRSSDSDVEHVDGEAGLTAAGAGVLKILEREGAKIQAIAADYDGTLTEPGPNEADVRPIMPALFACLVRKINAGCPFTIMTGQGRAIIKNMQESVAKLKEWRDGPVPLPESYDGLELQEWKTAQTLIDDVIDEAVEQIDFYLYNGSLKTTSAEIMRQEGDTDQQLAYYEITETGEVLDPTAAC